MPESYGRRVGFLNYSGSEQIVVEFLGDHVFGTLPVPVPQ